MAAAATGAWIPLETVGRCTWDSCDCDAGTVWTLGEFKWQRWCGLHMEQVDMLWIHGAEHRAHWASDQLLIFSFTYLCISVFPPTNNEWGSHISGLSGALNWRRSKTAEWSIHNRRLTGCFHHSSSPWSDPTMPWQVTPSLHMEQKAIHVLLESPLSPRRIWSVRKR